MRTPIVSGVVIASATTSVPLQIESSVPTSSGLSTVFCLCAPEKRESRADELGGLVPINIDLGGYGHGLTVDARQ